MPDEAEFLKQIMGERRMLQSYVRAILRDAHLIEDVIQDVFVVALKQRDQFATGTDLGAWLRAIARRTALSALRKVDRMGALVSPETLDALERNLEERSHSAWEAEREALRACLKELPPHSHQLLAYKYADEHSIEQISSATGRSIDSIKSLLKRVRAILARCISLRLKSTAVQP
jgi:RNA polymerase sigma-70 factor, ECF subfamily